MPGPILTCAKHSWDYSHIKTCQDLFILTCVNHARTHSHVDNGAFGNWNWEI